MEHLGDIVKEIREHKKHSALGILLGIEHAISYSKNA